MTENTISNKHLAYMTLVMGLIISVVAIWYSVAGLAAIFAGAAIPIIIMGVVLEVSKLVATIWLKWNWKQAPWHLKTYLISAIAVLMLITSMGIFGFLSKAHLDQAVPAGEVSAQVSLIDEKINNERETIANARTLLGQLDKAVTDISSAPDREVNGRTVSSAERALQVRRQQARDRAALTKTIEEAQARIVKLQEEKAPIASQLRAVEAEVGPIKYVAALIYGDNPDANLLEKAVRWVIIIIVLVFDPLAVALLLSSQYSFQWSRKEQLEKETITNTITEKVEEEPLKEPEPVDTGYVYAPWPFTVDEETKSKVSGDLTSPARFGLEKIEKKQADIDEANSIVSEIPPEVDVDVIIDSAEEVIKHDDEIIESSYGEEKEAMKQWKIDHPDDSLKHQRKLYEMKLIDRLPWDNYLKAKADFINDDAAEEAAKWALEQVEKSSTYQQNAEQGESTIWKKLKEKKDE
jgi:hypothetical protein